MSTISRRLETLDCYRMAREFRQQVSRLVKRLPAAEEYRLKDALLRAMRGVTAELARGHGTGEHEDRVRSSRKARGLMLEVLDHLTVASDEGYITEEVYETLCVDLGETWESINGYVALLESYQQ